MKIIIVFCLACAGLMAQDDAAQPAAQPTDKQIAAFWKAVAAKAVPESIYNGVVADLQATCGPDRMLTSDPKTQDPTCVDKPKPKPPAAAATKP